MREIGGESRGVGRPWRKPYLKWSREGRRGWKHPRTLGSTCKVLYGLWEVLESTSAGEELYISQDLTGLRALADSVTGRAPPWKLSDGFQSMTTEALGSVAHSVVGLPDTFSQRPQCSIGRNSTINCRATRHKSHAQRTKQTQKCVSCSIHKNGTESILTFAVTNLMGKTNMEIRKYHTTCKC